MRKLTFNTVAREICKREKSESREVNITDVKRTLRHLLDFLAENEVRYWDERGTPPSPLARFFNQYIPQRIKKIRESRKSKRPTGKKGR